MSQKRSQEPPENTPPQGARKEAYGMGSDRGTARPRIYYQAKDIQALLDRTPSNIPDAHIYRLASGSKPAKMYRWVRGRNGRPAQWVKVRPGEHMVPAWPEQNLCDRLRACRRMLYIHGFLSEAASMKMDRQIAIEMLGDASKQ